MANAADMAARIRRTLDALDHPALIPFLADWPARLEPRPIVAATLPVLCWITQLANGPASFAGELIAALCSAAASLDWRQTYTSEQMDAHFLDNYGWCEMVGTRGPLKSAAMACGFLLLGPDTLYPRHRHEAEEIYLPLSGIAEWQQGGMDWRAKVPGTLIHHAANESHAMRTDSAPLLALYLWRGADLNGKARLEL